MQGWQAGFNSQQPGVTVNYDPVGSGGGREQFLAGGVDFAGSDAALNDDELTKAKTRCGDRRRLRAAELHLGRSPSSTTSTASRTCSSSPATLAEIFNGSITTWNDPAIAADNPDAKLPSTRSRRCTAATSRAPRRTSPTT